MIVSSWVTRCELTILPTNALDAVVMSYVAHRGGKVAMALALEGCDALSKLVGMLSFSTPVTSPHLLSPLSL